MAHKIIRVDPKSLQQGNIRTKMDAPGLARLGDSLKKGQKFAIVITASGKIIDGHRRVAAAIAAGITELDAIVVADDLTPEQIADLQTVHAFHSEALPEYDRALALEAKAKASGMSNKQLADFFDLDPSAVTQYRSLFACIPAVQELAAQGKLGRTKWYEISRSPDQEETLRLLNGGATRDEIKRSVKRAKGNATPAVKASKVPIRLQNGAVITVAGLESSLDDVIEYLTEAAKLAKKARDQGLDAKTAVRVWADMAANG